MSSFANLVSSAVQADGSLACTVPDDWRQGRTAYGGLTTAIGYEAARRVASDLPALRSAQIAFVGPAGGALQARASLLRRGKSSAFVEVRVTADRELALLGTFLFMADRTASLDLPAAEMTQAPAPETAEPAMRGKGPAYRSQMEYRHAATRQDRLKPELTRWVRLRDRDGMDRVSELLLIGDALPAPILPLFDRSPTVSSATWTLHLHTTDIDTHEGWWLLQSKANTAAAGISHQSMSLWNRAGKAIMTGSQTVSFYEVQESR